MIVDEFFTVLTRCRDGLCSTPLMASEIPDDELLRLFEDELVADTGRLRDVGSNFVVRLDEKTADCGLTEILGLLTTLLRIEFRSSLLSSFASEAE